MDVTHSFLNYLKNISFFKKFFPLMQTSPRENFFIICEVTNDKCQNTWRKPVPRPERFPFRETKGIFKMESVSVLALAYATCSDFQYRSLGVSICTFE